MHLGLTDAEDGLTKTSAPHIPTITILGQPNSGKTTLFNLLTGANYTTSNYAGTTVEFSSGRLHPKFEFNATIIDVPGITSLYPKSPDEQVSVDTLFAINTTTPTDLVILSVDCSQLSRQLYLAKQVLDSGFRTVIALTMPDLLLKKRLEVDESQLQSILGCPVIKINGRTGEGIQNLVEQAVLLYGTSLFSKTIPVPPAEPTEETVTVLYQFAEQTEEKVIRNLPKTIDLQEINRSVFNSRISTPDPFSIKIDKFLLHPWWGIVFFGMIMSILFTSIFWLAQPLMDMIGGAFDILSATVTQNFTSPAWLVDLIAQGFIGGVGTVLTFVPQIMILFLLLGVLEDSGYLARGAMIIDKPLSKIGLNGRSFVPMLSGFACAIPAIMAARTIPNRRERLLTIFIIPLMSCSARLPVYALLLALLVPRDQPWIGGVALGIIYLTSLFLGTAAAGIINRFRRASGPTGLMLELPAYRRPILRFILRNTYYRSVSYLTKAGPTIVVCCLIIWALTYFPNVTPNVPAAQAVNLSAQELDQWVVAERTSTSFAADFGRMIEPVLRPLGWDWRVGVALMSAFAAREVFVSAMILSLRISDDGDNFQHAITNAMRNAKVSDSNQTLFTPASTIALIVFFMIAMQCISTLAIARKETGSWRIPILQQTVYSLVAYGAAMASVAVLNAFGVY